MVTCCCQVGRKRLLAKETPSQPEGGWPSRLPPRDMAGVGPMGMKALALGLGEEVGGQGCEVTCL